MDAVLTAPPQIAILVESKDVEPAVLALLLLLLLLIVTVILRLQEANFFALPHAIETLISHRTHPINGHASITFLDQYRGNLDLIHLILTAKVVDEIGNRQQIQGSEHFRSTVTGGVVVIPMDGKDGQIDGIVFIFVVDRATDVPEICLLVRHNLDLDRIRSHAVASNNFHCFVQGASGWLVIVKEVTGEQYHVALMPLG
mmetsp:Transcript_30048/g.70380  ORF Transcript_30048/g.70380 Transcript_30048/m.70380 type:complete len:200 (+) Transcript_30048:2033-2632(+)